ncbi:MAG TPA: helix-turn-helix transcriptional regulator [Solirubrobacteraceae bacterium]|nr:helix-turn-helix transcriptional regulator [Solirubrobacteraceae bacterium]
MAADRPPGGECPQVPTNAALGRAIRRLRRQREVTIEALAFQADMHITYLSQIERGLRNPTWNKLCGLAVALDTPISTIASEAEHDTCPVCGALNPEAMSDA